MTVLPRGGDPPTPPAPPAGGKTGLPRGGDPPTPPAPPAGGKTGLQTPPSITVCRAGALTTVQDCGRPGYAHLGVPRSGALDAPAHHQANRLVGNPPGAAVLETTLTGVAVIAEAAVT